MPLGRRYEIAKHGGQVYVAFLRVVLFKMVFGDRVPRDCGDVRGMACGAAVSAARDAAQCSEAAPAPQFSTSRRYRASGVCSGHVNPPTGNVNMQNGVNSPAHDLNPHARCYGAPHRESSLNQLRLVTATLCIQPM